MWRRLGTGGECPGLTATAIVVTEKVTLASNSYGEQSKADCSEWNSYKCDCAEAAELRNRPQHIDQAQHNIV